MTFEHRTVLLNEAVEALRIQPDGHYVDGTFGRGGHSRAILARLSPAGRLTVFDKDPQAVAVAQALAAQDARVTVRHEGFAALAALPPASLDGILLDLGVSSPQLDDAARGFSFRHDGPLDMRMDPTRGVSAAEWLAKASVAEMTEVIRDYGEERFAASIAKAIDRRRQTRGPVRTTAELAEIVAGAVKTREPGQDPATRTFQAIRIHVNAELEELQQALDASLSVLRPGGRLVVISFHSLEDRRVKRFLQAHARPTLDRRLPMLEPPPPRWAEVARVRPSAAEVASNPRARSAVMRCATRTAAPAVAERGERGCG
ncbi:Ribosomal RNA small subunit methyltransferase H [Tepidimonas alkaliphilus]|uniref:Ribosomal RNA small subunit methyltransferase H n=1 Tax=Tepidimonas alkaliphilus TaxID=2588942 RepID=A0A554W933_9BURK|nr:Ribosomal RNA small subunit methyltransferase H [Tepidimonas alkaliphilus]